MNEAERTLRELLRHAIRKHPQLRQVVAATPEEREMARFLNALDAGGDAWLHASYRRSGQDPLAALCDLHGSDKGEVASIGHPYPWPSHNYTEYYSRLFGHCRNAVQRVFECGLGTNNPDLPSTMGVNGRPGASLRVWRDYFPNALIYGADVDAQILFQEERIRTFRMDQRDPASIRAYWQQVGEERFDLMLDDGLHTFEAGSTLFTHSIDRLAPTGIYVIEDVVAGDLLRYQSFFASTEYVVDYLVMQRPQMPLSDNNLVVIRRAHAA